MKVLVRFFWQNLNNLKSLEGIYATENGFLSFNVIVETLQSHMILTMSHWSSGLTCLLPATRVTGSKTLGGTYVKPGFSC
jgi:hypothetical protein